MKKTSFLFWSFTALALTFIACDDENEVPINNPVGTCMPASLQNGLVAAYSFGNGSYQDVIGSADLNGVLTVPAADRDNNAGCAVQFQGNGNSYLMTQDTNWLNGLEEFSIALWYQPLGTQWGYELLIGRGDGLHCPDTNGEWSVGLYDVRRAVFGHGNSVWEDYPTADPTNTWKYLVVTCNKTGNILNIYVDGQLMDTDSGFGDCGPVTSISVNDMGNLYIGKNFNGKIDDIAIYNKVLTTAEIDALFELDPCCTQ